MFFVQRDSGFRLSTLRSRLLRRTGAYGFRRRFAEAMAGQDAATGPNRRCDTYVNRGSNLYCSQFMSSVEESRTSEVRATEPQRLRNNSVEHRIGS